MATAWQLSVIHDAMCVCMGVCVCALHAACHCYLAVVLNSRRRRPWGTPSPPWGQAPAAMSDAKERLPPSLDGSPHAALSLPGGGRSRPGGSSSASTSSSLVRAKASQCPEGVKRKPDARQCNCCSCKDSDWDEIDGEPTYMWWGYTPNPDGTSRGDV